MVGRTCPIKKSRSLYTYSKKKPGGASVRILSFPDSGASFFCTKRFLERIKSIKASIRVFSNIYKKRVNPAIPFSTKFQNRRIRFLQKQVGGCCKRCGGLGKLKIFLEKGRNFCIVQLQLGQ